MFVFFRFFKMFDQKKGGNNISDILQAFSWHWFYYPHSPRDSVIPVCGIFLIFEKGSFC